MSTSRWEKRCPKGGSAQILPTSIDFSVFADADFWDYDKVSSRRCETRGPGNLVNHFSSETNVMKTETKPSYSPGLEGVIAGETAICWVDPNAGLLYRGYDVHDLAKHTTFEEVAWLLLHGERPAKDQLDEFARALAAERTLPAPVTEMLRLLPADTHPMDALRTGVSAA